MNHWIDRTQTRQTLGEQSSGRRWRRLWTQLAIGLVIAGSVHAAALSDRLDAVAQAVDRQLGVQGRQAFPENQRRIAWLYLAGDKLPDALVIARRSSDECASVQPDKLRCRAFLLKAGSDGSFAAVADFTFGGHPVILAGERQGALKYVFVPVLPGSATPYRRYVVMGTQWEETDPQRLFTVEQAIQEGSLELDDRSMPRLDLQRLMSQAGADGNQARLAPSRVVFDGINVSSLARDRRYDAAVAPLAASLQQTLQQDLATVTARLPWPLPLEARLWDCVDWMVVRKFWEVEGRRLGRIGLCVDALAFGASRPDLATPAELLAAARYRLLQEVGIAYVLRVFRHSVKTKGALKSGDSAVLQEYGAAAGLVIGQRLQLLKREEILRAHATWLAISQAWFETMERRERGYDAKSPELQAFDEAMHQRYRATLCALQTLGQAPVDKQRGDHCSPAMASMKSFLLQDIQESLAP